MASSDAFALRRSGLNEFLFAAVGAEANGTTLSLVSVFARLGNDPWQEAARLAELPKPEATESLAELSRVCNQHLATPSCDDDCHSVDRAATDTSRIPRAESVCIRPWCQG